MYHHLVGNLVSKSAASVVVEAGGIGYELSVPLSTYERLPAVDSDVRLLTHLHVREDMMRLYGFATPEERELFRMLIGVSGIGPMLAMAVLSGTSVEMFRKAVLNGEVALLKSIRGVGARTAERMVLELRDPVGRMTPGEGGVVTPEDTAGIDAVAALVSLGFSRSKAEDAISSVRKKLGSGTALEDLVREALKST